MKKAVIFDLDGTLVQSLPDISASMNRVLERFGLEPHPLEAYNYMVGNGARRLTGRAIRDRQDLLEPVYQAYVREYAAHSRENTHVYEGIPELLDRLRALRVPACVFSNKDDGDVANVVRYYFPQYPFAAVRGRREGVPLKPAPDGALLCAEQLGLAPGEFLYVGDTGTDMDCGSAAGMTTVGVTWGFRTAQELRDHGACRVIDRPAELIDCLYMT